MALIEARSLAKTYRMGDIEVPALRGVDLELYRGEFVVLLGPSGSGKSTLLNILGGLDVPSAGHTTCEGISLPLQGQQVSEAYASTVRLSFDVRGGLLGDEPGA